MQGFPGCCGWFRNQRFILLAGVLLAGLAFALMGPKSTRAETPPLVPQGVAGYQTTDKLLVTVNLTRPGDNSISGKLRIELIGQDGAGLVERERAVEQSDPAANYAFELPAVKQAADKITFRCTFNQHKVEAPLSQILVVKAHETSLSSSQELLAGSTAAIRCGVHGVKSLTETVPLPGATVRVELRGKDGKVVPLAFERTGANGVVQPQFKVPGLPSGQYTLVVTTKSALGEEKLERDIRVKNDPKILLVTDKPLYQPGQVIHIRALALQAFDLKPTAARDLTFEVEDAKGNKVFKRTQPTSEFGVAAVDFQLADEVNMGDYHVRAQLGDMTSDKTVNVKRYVLPKFKADLKTDKKYYLPKETIQADLQSDYFFGKPVSEGKVKVTASTFDVQFRTFQTWEGKTDKDGHAKFEIKLPDYFVGQPLEKGNAIVRLEVKLTDTADHTETISKTYPVANQPIQISLIPEGGRLVPGVENKVFAAAVYPDGAPASCSVSLWLGREAKGKPYALVKTNEAGLAEFRVTPKAEQLRQGQWGQQNVEMLGGTQPSWRPQILFDLFAAADDGQGHRARANAEVHCDPLGENILLRLDKAIYQAGQSIQMNTLSTAGLPTAYIDVIKSGQTLVSNWIDLKDGAGNYKLDLPPEIFGTLEIHAYQMLASGEIIRDSRVVYVQPGQDLKIDVKADKDVYLPGQEGVIRFQVTDAAGKPTAAALGVIVVDEAVYALQDMQPGLEKVYFTLQEELLKPQAQAVFKPAETIDALVRPAVLPDDKQQIAQVLLTSVRPKVPARWAVDPVLVRRQQVEGQIQSFGWALYNYVAGDRAFMDYDRASKKWRLKPGLFEAALKNWGITPNQKDPFGKPYTLDSLAQIDKNFTVDRLARAATLQRMQQLFWAWINYANQNQAKWLKNGRWEFPETVLADAMKSQRLPAFWGKDAWGNPIKLVKRDKKREHQSGWTHLDYHDLVSAGPDGKFGTEDDVTQGNPNEWHLAQWWWLDDVTRLNRQNQGMERLLGMHRRDFGMQNMRLGGMAMGGMGGGGMAPGAPARLMDAAEARPMAAKADGKPTAMPSNGPGKGGGGSGPPTRIREYFPETLFWQPALIADDQGRAELKLPLADSITTWRLTASASSKGGLLGGVSAPLRVFQDFFVDLDLPITLTQNDEVAFPVAVYNYLKTPQTVRLELQKEGWFELADEGGFTRSLDLQANEVTSVKFRIKARKIGYQPLTVKATGSKMSDAVKRSIDVVPDGTKVEKVFSDKLGGRVTQTVDIPGNAVPDSYKLLVKIYPGVFSQVLEGTEGMLRLPGG